MRGTEYMPRDNCMVWIFWVATILRKYCDWSHTSRRKRCWNPFQTGFILLAM